MFFPLGREGGGVFFRQAASHGTLTMYCGDWAGTVKCFLVVTRRFVEKHTYVRLALTRLEFGDQGWSLKTNDVFLARLGFGSIRPHQ